MPRKTPNSKKEDYSFEELIAISEKALQSFLSTVHTVMEVTDYSGFTGWKELNSLELGSVFYVESENKTVIKNILQHKDEFSIDFLTILQPGQSFLAQWHDCEEDVVVKFGAMADKLDDSIYAERRDFVHYPKLKKHHPYNPSNRLPTKLEVTFYNPFINLEE